ncbi:MAG: hypothetical protein JSS00_00150 [Proteobacteria bacterium]|nr:hypothetical protein [Pseudomonadota bacterium]
MADWTAKLRLAAASRTRTLRSLRGACVTAVASIAAFAASALAADQAPRAFRAPGDCFQPLDRTNALTLTRENDQPKLEEIASRCASEAQQRPQRGMIFAYFYAGWANVQLGAGPLQPPRDDAFSIDSADSLDERQLHDATTLLDISARMASISGADQATLTAQRRARLELARAHRLLGLRPNDQDHFDQAERELNSLSRDGGGDLQNSIAFERAMLVIDRRRGDVDTDDTRLQSVLQDLSVFTNIDPRPGDQYIVRRGPMQLARLAVYLGDRALNRQPVTFENTQLALGDFRYAVGAYGVLSELGSSVDPVQAANTRVRMGLIDLRMARVLVPGQSQETTYGCSPEADSFSINEANRAFREALALNPRSSDAQWGLGCTLMARNIINGAVEQFRLAVRGLDEPGERALPRSEYYLGLARALAASPDQWDGQDGAIAYMQRAADSEPDVGRKAAIYLEIADIYRRNERWADERLSLQRSLEARQSARAYLQLGELLYTRPELDGSAVGARTNLNAAVQIAGPHQAEAYYYLSKVEQRLSTVEQRAQHGRASVDFATQAVRLESNNAAYRQQACLTRIIFSRTHDQSGQVVCTANAADDPQNPDAYPVALFYEGLFWLREAYLTSGGHRSNNWGLAILAFERGASAQGGREVMFDDHNNDMDRIPLGRLLDYGRWFALHCAGLDAAVQQQPGSHAVDREREDFKQLYDLRKCWAD